LPPAKKDTASIPCAPRVPRAALVYIFLYIDFHILAMEVTRFMIVSPLKNFFGKMRRLCQNRSDKRIISSL
jgi:hypothetical protein